MEISILGRMVTIFSTFSENMSKVLPFLLFFTVGVYISGVLAAIGSASLGLFCILSVIQLSMISSRDKVVMSYKPLVIIKLILAIISGKFELHNGVSESITNLFCFL